MKALVLPDEASPLEKYLFKPLYGSSHHWALEVLSDVSPQSRVLDIGAGGGGMGKALRTHGPSRLIAVEIDATARAALEPIYDAVHPDPSPLVGKEQFDVVLMLDVLEHMVDPFGFLKNLAPLLAPGARVVISVPNVAHWSVRLPLMLLGRFEYVSRGILDKTHLQFFSRRRFIDLLSAVPGGRIEVTSASIEPVEFVLPGWMTENAVFALLARVRRAVAQAIPGLFAYQHLGVVRIG